VWSAARIRSKFAEQGVGIGEALPAAFNAFVEDPQVDPKSNPFLVFLDQDEG
jgi:hypothetical protein